MHAEPVGLGKTYTALAVAAAMHETLIIVAPASLRAMWSAALRACGIDAPLVTHEALSRGAATTDASALIIVDEAHRLRSITTRRYAALSNLSRGARILLVTATPVQNRRADLAAQLALFLGRAAWSMTDAELAEHVVRTASSDHGGQPALRGPFAIALPEDDDCLDAIASLPPPVPAKNESLAVALATCGLVHQWTSSRAALIAALERRRARGLALSAALEAGRHPTRAELSAWTHSGDAIQLAFPELVVAHASSDDSDDVDPSDLAASLERHDAAVRVLLARLRTGRDPDADRAAALRRIRSDHPGERVIAFCHYTETVNALRVRMSGDAGVAALTARGARVAGGQIDRVSVLAQFIPPGGGGLRTSAAEHISLLITTDLLSEGLNLQQASVIVHLDLPWNPARLEQRVGRARRLGSTHDVVTVYVVEPPASADRLLRISDRLRDKLGAARKTIGEVIPLLPWMTGPAQDDGGGCAESNGAVDGSLRGWLRPPASAPEVPSEAIDRTLVAGVEADFDGWLALVRDGQAMRIVVNVGAGVETDPRAVRRAIRACDGGEVTPSFERADVARRALGDWLAKRRGLAAVDLRGGADVHPRRAALARGARVVSTVPRHQRAVLAPLADAARRALTMSLTEGNERALDLLAGAATPDADWLRALADFGESHAPARTQDPTSSLRPAILALILLEP